MSRFKVDFTRASNFLSPSLGLFFFFFCVLTCSPSRWGGLLCPPVFSLQDDLKHLREMLSTTELRCSELEDAKAALEEQIRREDEAKEAEAKSLKMTGGACLRACTHA